MFTVKQKYRTNPLSKEPGGKSVFVEYADGRIIVYDKVKYPGAYVRSLSKTKNNVRVVKAWYDDKVFNF